MLFISLSKPLVQFNQTVVKLNLLIVSYWSHTPDRSTRFLPLSQVFLYIFFLFRTKEARPDRNNKVQSETGGKLRRPEPNCRGEHSAIILPFIKLQMYHLSLRSVFCLFLRGRLSLVLLYFFLFRTKETRPDRNNKVQSEVGRKLRRPEPYCRIWRVLRPLKAKGFFTRCITPW